MGTSREWQMVPGTTQTALLAGAGTTKVIAHPAHTAHASSLALCVNKSRLPRPLCNKLIAIVHRDLNCSSSSESDCIRFGLDEADLHNPECSSVQAGHAVNASLNVSSALSRTSLAQPRSASEQARSSVHTSQLNQLQGEYPPRAVTRVRGDLSPPCYDGVNPKGLTSDSASPAQAGGKTLGLVAPLTSVADSSTVEEFDPSGLARVGPVCHSIASQSGNQSDSQSDAHTALSATDGPQGPLDCQKSTFIRTPSCGCAHAPAHTAHPHPTFQFQLASSQCLVSTGEALGISSARTFAK